MRELRNDYRTCSKSHSWKVAVKTQLRAAWLQNLQSLYADMLPSNNHTHRGLSHSNEKGTHQKTLSQCRNVIVKVKELKAFRKQISITLWHYKHRSHTHTLLHIKHSAPNADPPATASWFHKTTTPVLLKTVHGLMLVHKLCFQFMINTEMKQSI